MYCQNRISYRVQEGDSLYKLAKQFHTTVTELILLNSGVNPYNLQTGMRLTICPGEGYVDENESKPSEGNTNKPTKTPVGGIVIIPGTTTQPGGTTRPGTTTQPGTATRPGTTTQPENNMGVDLRQRMRMAWLNHITRRVQKCRGDSCDFCSVLSGFSNAEIPQTFYGAFASDR